MSITLRTLGPGDAAGWEEEEDRRTILTRELG